MRRVHHQVPENKRLFAFPPPPPPRGNSRPQKGGGRGRLTQNFPTLIPASIQISIKLQIKNIINLLLPLTQLGRACP